MGLTSAERGVCELFWKELAELGHPYFVLVVVPVVDVLERVLSAPVKYPRTRNRPTMTHPAPGPWQSRAHHEGLKSGHVLGVDGQST